MPVKENSLFGPNSMSQPTLDQPANYRIRVRGDLDDHWSNRLQGMEIDRQLQENGSTITTLEGKLLDQAALMGVLVVLNNLSLPLISVTWLELNDNEGNDLLKVEVTQNADYLEFIVTGTYDLESAIAKFPLVIAACRQTGKSKVLIDHRDLAGEIMLTQELLYAHRAGEFHQEHLAAGGQPLKIAFVGHKTLSDAVTNAIGNTYGLDGIVTSDYMAAIEWLCAES